MLLLFQRNAQEISNTFVENAPMWEFVTNSFREMQIKTLDILHMMIQLLAGTLDIQIDSPDSSKEIPEEELMTPSTVSPTACRTKTSQPTTPSETTTSNATSSTTLETTSTTYTSTKTSTPESTTIPVFPPAPPQPTEEDLYVLPNREPSLLSMIDDDYYLEENSTLTDS